MVFTEISHFSKMKLKIVYVWRKENYFDTTPFKAMHSATHNME
jgi:hypothetical protein